MNTVPDNKTTMTVMNACGAYYRTEAVSEGIIRLRYNRTGVFSESLQERYGIIRPLAPVQARISGTSLITSKAELQWHADRQVFSLLSADGRVLNDAIEGWSAGDVDPIAEHSSHRTWQGRVESVGNYFRANPRESGAAAFQGQWRDAQGAIIGAPSTVETGSTSGTVRSENDMAPHGGASLRLKPGDRCYGLGAASARKIQLRGGAYRNWVQYFSEGNLDPSFAKFEQSEGPIPFLMVLPPAAPNANVPRSPAWAVFFNTTWLNFFDVGRLEEDRLLLLYPQGELDLYLFIAPDAPGLLERFSALTGRPTVLPRWAYGFHYVSNIVADQHVVPDEAERLRREQIPCDVFGLEPNWMAKFYDNSRKREWDCEKRFYMPTWMARQHSMTGAMDRLGFKMSLWVNCDQDFSIEEERRWASEHKQPDPHPEAEADWMEHLKAFMNDSATAFKIDPNSTTAMHPGRLYSGGRSDLEFHNLQQTLVRKAMQRMMESHSGQRAMFHYCAAWTGSQAHGAVTMGDNGGEALALAWMLGYGLTGVSNTACDMAPTPWRTWPSRPAAGLHFGFLSPWSQLNNWSSSLQPWYLGEEGLKIFRDYARLRYQLLPYIYSAAHVAAQTGLPILRAMPLAFPDDATCSDLITQYMLGPSLLVSAFTERIWLPEGKWYDWWTGQSVAGGRWIEGGIPENRGGHLFVKAGAVIPMWDDPPAFIPRKKLPYDLSGVNRAILDNYAPDAPEPVLTFAVWPGASSEYRLYEDDGESLDYREHPVTGRLIRLECHSGMAHRLLIPQPDESSASGKPRTIDIRIVGMKGHQVSIQGQSQNALPGLMTTSDAGENAVIRGLAWDREISFNW